MTNSDRYFVVFDDVYIFKSLDSTIRYFEEWENTNAILFDNQGTIYTFINHYNDPKNSNPIDLGNCIVEIKEHQESNILSILSKSGFINPDLVCSFATACDYLESRFGYSD